MRINDFCFILMQLDTTEPINCKQLKLAKEKHTWCYDKTQFWNHQIPFNTTWENLLQIALSLNDLHAKNYSLTFGDMEPKIR